MTVPVSIIIPTYNRGAIIKDAIENVLKQTFTDYELIIIDDGSTDNTGEIVQRISDSRIRYIKHEKNKGEATARNTGVVMAKGEYIACQDDDCICNPDKIAKQFNRLYSAPKHVGVVYCGAWFNTDTERKYIPEVAPDKREGDIYAAILREYFIGSVQVMARRECFNRVGLFDTSLPAGIDWDMWIRLARYYEYSFIDEPLVEIYYSPSMSYYNQSRWLSGSLMVLDKHHDDFQRLDRDGCADRYYNLGILHCTDNNADLFKTGRRCLSQALMLRAKPKYIMFITLSLCGRWLFTNSTIVKLYYIIKGFWPSLNETVKGIYLSLIGLGLWLCDKHYRSMKNEERFWTRLFSRADTSEFVEWVNKNSKSRQAVCSNVKKLGAKTVLDVGCGMALDYEQYGADNIQVEYHGIDLTQPFIDAVKKKYPEVDVKLGSIEQIGYPDSCFDAVTCRHVLEHLGSVTKAISEMARVSKKYVIITWFLPPTNTEVIRTVRWKGRKRVHYNRYSIVHIIEILRNNGLTLQNKSLVGTDEVWVCFKN